MKSGTCFYRAEIAAKGRKLANRQEEPSWDISAALWTIAGLLAKINERESLTGKKLEDQLASL